jgi:hypothetical protein
MFAVVRHPDIEALGVLPEGALELQRVHGWYRVSPWAPEPADLHLPDYAEVFTDLDAPAPEPEPEPVQEPKKAPAKTTKESKA